MSIKTDCIYFEKKEEDTGWNHCKRTSRLDNNGELCKLCRLWDNYIPSSSSKEQIERAIKWQNMPFSEQPYYEDYFEKEDKE